MNSLTLGATLGILVLAFQEGWLDGLLDYTGPAAIEVTSLVFLFAVIFGLATDYAVLVMARIKEQHDLGDSNEEAVAIGIARTGRVITAAALAIAVVFLAFGVSTVFFVKQIAIGMAVGVLIDATIVRALLVPSLMRLLGEWNWWAPGAPAPPPAALRLLRGLRASRDLRGLRASRDLRGLRASRDRPCVIDHTGARSLHSESIFTPISVVFAAVLRALGPPPAGRRAQDFGWPSPIPTIARRQGASERQTPPGRRRRRQPDPLRALELRLLARVQPGHAHRGARRAGRALLAARARRSARSPAAPCSSTRATAT